MQWSLVLAAKLSHILTWNLIPGLQSQQDLAQLINLEHGNHRHESRLSQSTYSSHLTEIIKLAEETGVQLCLIPTRCFVPTWYFDSVLVTPQLNTAILDQFMVPHIRYPNYVGLSWILLYIFQLPKSPICKKNCVHPSYVDLQNLFARLSWHQQKHSISWIVHLREKKCCHFTSERCSFEMCELWYEF